MKEIKMHFLKTILLLFLLFPTGYASAIHETFPVEIEQVLQKAKQNRKELEKALLYFKKERNPQKLQAIEFLISNMDIHYSETYYWKDRFGHRIDFNELDYPDITTALAALDSIRMYTDGLQAQDTILYDVECITGDFLIHHINHTYATWKKSIFKDIPFESFCEYVLPYRATTEPLTDWFSTYNKRYQWIGDSLRTKSLERVLEYTGADYKMWFTSSYNRKPLIENEPLPRQSALQLLFRKWGACEDITALQVFSLRSQGVPCSYNFIPLWATSMGSHFTNTVFDTQMRPLRLDVTNNTVVNRHLNREPAKVLHITYSKQSGTLASLIDWRDIPPCFLRTTNYIDVTPQWWETSDVTIDLFNNIPMQKIAYAYVYNWGEWQPAWWGEVKSNKVTFCNMPKGVVILPVYYDRKGAAVAGHPMINGYNHLLQLAPDTLHKRKVEIKQQQGYLIFRPGKSYELFYWDKQWISLGTRIAAENAESLFFDGVPQNALMRLIPEYSQGKERPFIILPNGERHWW